jgi:thioredoxin reductase
MAVLTAAQRRGDGDGPRVGVIGAGPCGLTAIKNLRDQGLRNIVCYDDGDEIGGNWVLCENTDRVSVYECTHIISSKSLSGFDDFPMPDDYPDFPSHRQVLAYFHDYATRFGLRQHIRLGSTVAHADRRADGRWAVQVSHRDSTAKETEVFDYLYVCAGHHREPNIPDMPGHFAGLILHSSAYRRGDSLRGKHVLVVGAGNSGCDIAADVSRFAAATSLSMRHGAYIAPKLMFGQPIDVVVATVRRFIPKPLLQPMLRLALRGAIGPWAAYGLQQPDHGPLEMHPTLNSSILEALRSGDVRPQVGIEYLDGDYVQFRNGRRERYDSIILSTGFRTSFPFLPSQFTAWSPIQPPPLYLKMMHGELSNIFFIGLFQPLGCIWNLADLQARIAAYQIIGRLSRPVDIAERIGRETAKPHWRYAQSPRHAVEVDAAYFRKELLRELSHASAAPRPQHQGA